jgi:hypothetical protein
MAEDWELIQDMPLAMDPFASPPPVLSVDPSPTLSPQFPVSGRLSSLVHACVRGGAPALFFQKEEFFTINHARKINSPKFFPIRFRVFF